MTCAEISDARRNESTVRLIAFPALISISVTALRLVGELLHWPKPLVNSDVCEKAILGVVWLVPICGTYFAVKLFHAGDAPQRFVWPMFLQFRHWRSSLSEHS